MKLRKKTGQKLLCIALFFVFVLAGAEQIQAGQKLIIFHAGSLAIPFKQICGAFIRNNPGVEVIREAAGSRTCARKIADLERPCDIMASADYTVIEKLLIPEYADWNISFATNEMAIMYRPDSRYAKDVNGHNWYKILLKKDVEYGHSDPNSDPCGYRSQLVWQLAEKYYQLPGLYNRLKSGSTISQYGGAKQNSHSLSEPSALFVLIFCGSFKQLQP